MSNKFYVYEHWRPDINKPFYVGKGTRRRANVMSHGRNLHHKAIQVKLSRLGLPIEIRIVKSDLSCTEAFELEIQMIAYWRAEGADLVNMTDGGDGVRNPSAEWRERRRQLLLGKKASEETRAKMRASHAKRPPQTSEHNEKARQNFLAKKVRKTPEQRAFISAMKKANWQTLMDDPVAYEKLCLQRTAEVKANYYRKQQKLLAMAFDTIH